MAVFLDEIDRKILRVLQRDGRCANSDLAHEVGLSPSPCLRRVKRLEEAGVVGRYVALLNPAAIGMSIEIFVRVTLDRQDTESVGRFTDQIQRAARVLECHMLAGDCDFLLRVVAADLAEYQQFVMNFLSQIPGVRNVKTEIPLETVKKTTVYPV
jgi:Lrp/AsnC family transcriptional regulator, leucine-responsive regulatory protein